MGTTRYLQSLQAFVSSNKAIERIYSERIDSAEGLSCVDREDFQWRKMIADRSEEAYNKDEKHK